jgi:DNA-binding transcriptional LysR family regulator
MSEPLFDLDLLRTLLWAAQTGSFKEAAIRVGRTQSAVSLQMNRLEKMIGAAPFQRNGRGITLTASGAILVDYARRMLALNDEAMLAVTGSGVRGTVRLGLLQDFAETVLPGVLAAFSGAHPAVEMDVQVEPSIDLLQGIRAGRLDLALLFSRDKIDLPSTRIGRLPMRWVVYPGFRPEESIRMVLFAAPCLFRETAATLLGRKEWKQTFSSSSLAGTWAAVEAGLGITLRTELGIPDHLETLSRFPGTGRLPTVDIVLLQSRTTPVVSRLKDCLVQRAERIVSADRRVGGPALVGRSSAWGG